MNTIIDTILDAAVIIAPITAIIMLLPQVPETWRIRHDSEKLKGISVGTQIFMAINSIMWMLMGVSMSSFSVAAASFVTLPVIIFTLYFVFRSRRRERERERANKVTAMTEKTDTGVEDMNTLDRDQIRAVTSKKETANSANSGR